MTIITELGNMFAGMPPVSATGKTAEESGDSFQNIISDMTKPQEYDYSAAATSQSVTAENKANAVQESQESASREELDGNRENADVTKTGEETPVASDEKVAETEQKVLEETAEALGMTEEELVEKLEEMGITVLDLLNPQNVTALVAEVKADGDVSALLTNEELTALVKEINGKVEDILTMEGQEMNLTGEEWKALVEKALMENADAKENGADKNVEMQTEAAVIADTENPEEPADNAVQKDAPKVAKEEDVDAAVKTDNLTAENTTENENASTGSNENAFQAKEGARQDTGVVANSGEMVSVNAPVNAPENFAQVLTQDIPTMGTTDPQEIVSQVLDQIKMQVKEDVTQLSMQLNPENLGTVGLTVASKEGNVTAQLLAQNDAVRAALEAQILVLKENLEQQGVKVDAIEVAVASHEFERNLEQGNDNNRQQDEMAEELKKATRKIDLNGISELDELEDLAEEELVTAKMMQADGNSMDYKV